MTPAEIAERLHDKWSKDYPAGVPWRRMLTDVRHAIAEHPSKIVGDDKSMVPVGVWMESRPNAYRHEPRPVVVQTPCYALKGYEYDYVGPIPATRT